MKPFLSETGFAILRVVNSLTLVTISMAGMFASIMVLEPSSREFDTGYGLGSLPYMLFMVGFGVGNVFIGKLIDRHGMFRFALLASICMPTGLYLAANAQDIWTFSAILLVLCGCLGSAFAFGPMVTDISLWFEKRRGFAIGIVISGTYLAGAVWPPLLQSWIDSQGWRQTFTGLSLFCLSTMIPLCLIYRKRRIPDPQETTPVSTGGLNRQTGMRDSHLQSLLCLAGVGCCAAMAMPQIHIVPYVLDLGFRAQDGAVMLAMMLGFGIVSRVASGWLSDYIGGTRTLLVGSGLQALAILSFLSVDSLSGLYLLSAAFGLAQGGIVPSYALIIRRFFPVSEAGERIGLVFLCTIGGMALGGWMAGSLYDLTGSYRISFLNAFAFNVLNMSIICFIRYRSRRGELARQPAA